MSKSAIALSVFLAASTAVQAQQPITMLPIFQCGPTDDVIKTLKEKFGETSAFIGIGSPTHMDHVFVNPETGSYTILRTNVEAKQSCILVSGESGEVSVPKAYKPSMPL